MNSPLEIAEKRLTHLAGMEKTPKAIAEDMILILHEITRLREQVKQQEELIKNARR